ncbi:hypothetical protein [Sulfurospirillum multivorans]|jgi:hypothetical protein|uniref:Uncharacterized protein n=2 Tax=Sulfurospirillum multivorans TaxID=66821 RepID=A0AA86AMX7_SULMK|nr:hypothetical protein [Sulfurospirillum multivorans]AHJ12577.1 hypothetical protein SMUL_1316 [Sulfurospirillum multivorans DSM 12446]QEH06072.1 hypothetical protein SMN_1301 [Sulfurospirillum multivorans]
MKSKTEMLPEYDFSKGVRGKYAEAYHKSVNVIKLDDDVSSVFPDAKAVNEALRTMIKLVTQNKPNLGMN